MVFAQAPCMLPKLKPFPFSICLALRNDGESSSSLAISARALMRQRPFRKSISSRFDQLHPVFDHVSPIDHSGGVLPSATFLRKGRGVLLVEGKGFSDELFVFVCLDRGDYADPLRGEEREVSNRRADDKATGDRRFPDRQRSALGDELISTASTDR